MIKLKRRIGSAFLACMMLLSLLPVTALAVNETIIVDSFNDLKSAQTAVEDSVVEISGNIEMTEAVTFTNKVTLKLTETANISYTSSSNSQLYLITLKSGSTLDMAAGAKVTMTGTGDQDNNRDWRAIYSDGSLTVTQFAGEITIENARGRALYANNDLTFNCPMSGAIKMNNPNGANTGMYGIVSYKGNITFNQGISEDASITIYYGGGNTAAGIAAQAAGTVTITGNMAGKINVQLGTSHACYGIYAATNGVKIAGDISGSIYARGGSGSGYGIYAENGDISIAKISGSVTGDCYNKEMANSQSGASALYAVNGSIYGSKSEDTVTPIELTGQLSSTVGRSGAFTVQAKNDVYIHVGETASIKAQSSYGADWTNLTGSYTGMEDNWGGTAACVTGNGTVSITGNKENLSVTSQSESGKNIETAGPLLPTGQTDNLNNIDSFLTYASLADLDEYYKSYAENFNSKLTPDDKALIDGYDEIIQDLNTVKVTDEQSLRDALSNAQEGDIIQLAGDITISASLTIDESITLSGAGEYTIKASDAFSGNEVILVTGKDVTIKDITIDGNNQSGYGIQFYTAADGKVENVTSINNTKRGLHINASTVTASGTIELEGNGWGDSINVGFGRNISNAPGASLDITNATLVGVDSIYADSGDVERAESDDKTISVTDGTNNYLAVGDTENPICFMPQDVVKAEASYSRQSEDGSNVTYYLSNLKKAVDNAGSGDTITVLKNIDNAKGISVDENKNFTIDFAGHTYILTGPGAGSSGTETNGFQLLKDSTITMKNGTIRIAENASNVNRIIQNYADLTLIDMQFYAENQVGGENYPLSFNNGNITFNGNTSIFTTSDDTIAFDVCKFSDYPSVNVVFDTDYTGTINGRILYDSPNARTHTLTIKGDGTFGGIDFTDRSASAAKEAIDIYSGTFCESVSEYVVDTLKYELRGANGTFTYYATEEAALAAAQPGDVVVAIGDISKTEYTVTVKNGDQIVAQGTVIANGKYILPAAPSRAGYSFRGWYGNGHLYAAGEAVQINEDTTFVAQWSDNTPYYTITVKDAENGTVTCYAKSAAKGADVTLTVKADVGYQLDKLTVTDASGKTVAVEKVNNTTYTFVMPGSKVTVEAVFAPTTVVEPSGLPFTDVSTSDWFYSAVKFVYENGLMDGVAGNLFAPNATLNRAMAVTILYRLEGSPAVTTDAGFNDVAAGTWYTDAVNWAAANNIVNGVEGNNFDPTGSLTREQMATVLYRYAQYKGADVSASGDIGGFVDSANVSSWAADAVKWAVGSGLVNGVEGNALAPQGTSTRAQAATVLMRFVG